jgi:hypothetical protein
LPRLLAMVSGERFAGRWPLPVLTPMPLLNW